MKAAKTASTGQYVAAAVIFGLILTGIFGFIGIPRTIVHLTGERVTAQVEDCEVSTSYRRGRKRTNTTCTGSWTTADGRQHRGEIDGAGTEHEGRQVAVRAKGDSAQLDDASLLWPAGCFCLSLLGMVGGIGFALSRRGGKRGGPPPAPPPGAWPGPPPPGRPPGTPPGPPPGPPPGTPPGGYPPPYQRPGQPPQGYGPPPGYPPPGYGPPPGRPGWR